MNWSRQGGAVVSPVRLTDGREGKVVLVAGRENPKGAIIVLADAASGSNAFPLPTLLSALQPDTTADILCMQERAFAATALPAPDILP